MLPYFPGGSQRPAVSDPRNGFAHTSTALRLRKDKTYLLPLARARARPATSPSNFSTPWVMKIHHDRRVEDALGFVEYQQLADRSRAHATDEDNQVKEAWLMKLEYPRHGHRSTRETYSQDLIRFDRSVAAVSHSTSASHQVTNKNKRTLPEGNETAIPPVRKKARLNHEPSISSADSTVMWLRDAFSAGSAGIAFNGISPPRRHNISRGRTTFTLYRADQVAHHSLYGVWSLPWKSCSKQHI
jgi:hypothetical protein